MGSFDYTCAVSRLPIHGGDPVRYLLLQRDPTHDSGAIAGWRARTFPVRARYDDYGNAANPTPASQLGLWKAGFDTDLIERGWGDNSIHDLRVAKDMPIEGILEAVERQRVRIRRREITPTPDKLRKGGMEVPKIPKGIPTRKRIEKLLKSFDLNIHEGGFGADTYMVDRVDDQTVRVRHADSSKGLPKLERRFRRLGRYAVVLRNGTGNYADSSELWIMPLPGTQKHERFRLNDPPLEVAQAMIREDVWQQVLNTPIKSSYMDAYTIEQYREATRKMWEDSLEKVEMFKGVDIDTMGFVGLHTFMSWVLTTPPFTVGLGTSWWTAVRAKWEGEDLSAFLDTVAEFACISDRLRVARFHWSPPGSVGPQWGEWQVHWDLLLALASVAEAHVLEESKRGDAAT